VRVGQEAGRKNPAGARLAGFVAIGLALAFMVLMTVLVVSLRHVLPVLFLDENMKDAAEIVSIASWLLLLGATFFVADGVQTAMAGSLRGLNDTKIPMLFAALSFWVIGFGALYLLAFPLELGVTGVWIGFTIGLIAYCIMLVTRFHLLTSRGYLPEAPKDENSFAKVKPLPAE
jgi:MATE family multidrug resistance protein